MDSRNTSRDARPDRPVKNLSTRITAGMLDKNRRLKRKDCDYSATGAPIAERRSIAVGADELLARLQGGQR